MHFLTASRTVSAGSAHGQDMTDNSEYIFIGGAARTGTTLLQSLICALPDTGAFLPESVPVKLLIDSFDKIAAHDERFNKVFFGEAGAEAALKHALDGLLSNIQAEGSTRYKVLKHPAATPLFSDIGNLLGTRAHFICTLRDPRDAIASMVEWGRRASEQGRFHWFARRDTEKLCRYFLSFYGPVFAQKNSAPITTVKYEDLVAAPEATLSGFVSKLGYEPDVLSRENRTEWGTVDLSATGPVGDATSPLYGKDVSASRVGAHADILTETEIAEIEACCEEFMERFGYERSATLKTSKGNLPLDRFIGLRGPLTQTVRTEEQKSLDRASQEISLLTEQIAQKEDENAKLRMAIKSSKSPLALAIFIYTFIRRKLQKR
ncbi:sulfotransferase family protein [Oricola thermophila]|uniref:Sulfotransferase n=1 Tax=Oricola thermophila TaxID=2742145 RepID=A0A6N1VD22_9HYPH|nr:sulfotransferase [Oricola thermophila]QKV18774.1 sulfotransferase [Oricola thermophila]